MPDFTSSAKTSPPLVQTRSKATPWWICSKPTNDQPCGACQWKYDVAALTTNVRFDDRITGLSCSV